MTTEQASSLPTTAVVSAQTHGRVRVIRIANPPVNALSGAVRQALAQAVDDAQAAADIDAIVLVGAGRHFVGGADIKEFGQAAVRPSLPEVCLQIERSAKPVIAAIQGAALGGGLELALASHYRIAASDSRLGLPEVLLGLMPGAGGTQRAPRLIGVRAALDLMLSGRHASGQEALALGLVDRVFDSGTALEAGLRYADELLTAGAGVRPTCDATTALADRSALDAARADVTKKSRGLFSPPKIVDAVEASFTLPFADGMRLERESFLQCIDSPQRAGLIHAFFAEKEVRKIPEAQSSQPRPIASVGVIGGGTMGAGIAAALLDAGLPVTMIERDEPSLERGRQQVAKVYDGLLARGRIDAAARDAVMARLQTSTRYEALAGVDLVVEAVFEDMAVKRAVFTELDRVCKPGAVLATNTSYLDIDEIASFTARPQDVIGLHFFSPANIMKLLEIVVPAKVAPDVVVTGFELAKRLGKVPVRAGVCDGFIGNRVLAVYRQAADYMVEDGASPWQIDKALRDFGFAMGPYQVADLAGNDIGWATRKRRAATRDPRARYVHVADRICERGWFGQKTGRGYYVYAPGSRTSEPNPDVDAILAEERAKAGGSVRSFTDAEIVDRYMAATINEGANVLHEGIAMRPLDVDAVFINGYGFPRHRGGPMKYADSVGLAKVLHDIRTYAEQDPLFWRASPLLVELVAQNKGFDSLNPL
ncbi:MAG: 3-hydroxyacyl-CoA dehydrogenase [Rhizobacter sp.]|nr:3-hydroxyacyl-CoA dehydrogenase [Rhizobacter sp.]